MRSSRGSRLIALSKRGAWTSEDAHRVKNQTGERSRIVEEASLWQVLSVLRSKWPKGVRACVRSGTEEIELTYS